MSPQRVIPANAGIHADRSSTEWIPASAGMTGPDTLRQLMADAARHLGAAGIALGPQVGGVPEVVDVRRRRLRPLPGDGDAGYLTLVRGSDGLLDWQVDGGPSATPPVVPTRRAMFEAQTLDQVAFKPVPGSQVSEFLARLDRGFNPRYGLYDLDGRRVDALTPTGRVLLLVHGTFSRGDCLLRQLHTLPDGAGRRFLAAARAHYTQVLVFEHPTLAVGPALNAIDLARAFAGSRAQVDVVAHSRGGLVARWWLELLD